VAKAVIDYLVTRADADPERIGLHGSSLGGYSGPRCATGEKRIKAVAVWSGAYNLVDDIFDYYPPIQDRLRWLMGAKDLREAREKIREFTLIGRANKIECPLLVGYSRDDRVMDPRGALNGRRSGPRRKTLRPPHLHRRLVHEAVEGGIKADAGLIQLSGKTRRGCLCSSP